MAFPHMEPEASMFAHVQVGNSPTRVSLWFRGTKVLTIRNLQELPPFVRYTRSARLPLKIETSLDGDEYSIVDDPNSRLELGHFLLLDPHALLLTSKDSRVELERDETVPLGRAIWERSDDRWSSSIVRSKRISGPRLTRLDTVRGPEGWNAPFVIEGDYQLDIAMRAVTRSPPRDLEPAKQMTPSRWFRASFVDGRPQELVQQDTSAGSEVVSTVFHWP